jgi:hypothetical protein
MCSLVAFRSPQHATNPGARLDGQRVGWMEKVSDEQYPPDSRRKGPQ